MKPLSSPPVSKNGGAPFEKHHFPAHLRVQYRGLGVEVRAVRKRTPYNLPKRANHEGLVQPELGRFPDFPLGF